VSLTVLDLPGRARALVLATFACTALLLGWSLAVLDVDGRTAATAAFLVGAAVLTAALSGSLRENRNSSSRLQSTDSCWTVAAAVLLPLPVVAPVAVVVRLLVTCVLTGGQRSFKLVFNLCVAALSAFAAGAVAHVALPAGLEDLGSSNGLLVVLGLAAVGAAHLVLDRLVVLAIALSEPSWTRRDLGRASVLDDFEVALVSLGLLLAPVLAVHLALGLLAVPLPVVLHRLTGAGVLWQAADRDAKTGLLTSTAWTSAAARTLARAAAGGREVAVLVVDLDHFKQVNDRHGHLAGDAVLRRTAETLRGALRPDTLLARFGGEEFVVLLPDAGAAVARATAERLREAVERQPRAVAEQDLPVTASVGVAVGSDVELTALLAEADRALYDAKRAGRNQVAVARSPMPDGV
jgi:diguanylate cyclase (GGDEF)-like protein